jgi:hypothetical protein
LFNVVESETLILYEQLSFEFLGEFDVFLSVETGEHESTKPLRVEPESVSTVRGQFLK